MGLCFFERMDGEVTDVSGTRSAVSFEAKVEAATVAAFVLRGRGLLTGVLVAPPWADHVPLSGTLRVSLPRRFMAYDLRFVANDGAPMRLFGRKELSPRAPLRSSSLLFMELRDAADRVVARGEMRFDLSESLTFVRSFYPSALPAASPAEVVGPLSHRARAQLAALAPAAIAAGQTTGAPAPSLAAEAEATMATAPAHVQAAWRGALAVVDGLVAIRHGRRLADLPLADRQRALEQLAAAGEGRTPLPGAALLTLAALPVRAAHYDRDDVNVAMGLPPIAPPAREPPPRWHKQIIACEDWDSDGTVEAEVVIVGTGAGGAALAAGLAAQGVAVALVEEGRPATRARLAGSVAARMRDLYRDGGMTATLGLPPVATPLGRVVGGTTVINSGTCLRAPDAIFARWQAELGAPDDLGAAAMARHYKVVERALGAKPHERALLGKVADLIGAGADAMGLPHGPLPRNAPDCDAQAACMVGCPTGAKRSADIAWLPKAYAAGARVYCGAPVTRILRHGRRVVGVVAEGRDASGRPVRLTVRAQAVVVSCGALRTPWLLAENGFRLPWLGRNLSLHPALGMIAVCPESMRPWAAVPQAYRVGGLEAEGIAFEGVYVPPSPQAAAMPLVGRPLAAAMELQERTAQFGFMIRDAGLGRVLRGVRGQPIAIYQIDRRHQAMLQHGAAVLAELMLRGGASYVLAGLGAHREVRTVDEARALRHAALRKQDFHLLGSHPLGTCRMGRSGDEAVIDFEHRVFGTDNLYVVDGAAVPTSLGVNPQMTIMATALRAAGAIAASLR